MRINGYFLGFAISFTILFANNLIEGTLWTLLSAILVVLFYGFAFAED